MADFTIKWICNQVRVKNISSKFSITFVKQEFVWKVEKGVVTSLCLGKRARDNSKETGRTTFIRKTEYADTNSTFTGADR